ncbi:MAG: hypothetical protein EBY21_14725, partial [Alphaproteobacteria bacterium]|nr:hypothetical protein [Alphaproteobacteria bacterium]
MISSTAAIISKSMPEEFAAYGLPAWTLWLVGALKVASALCLIIGVWVPALVLPATGLIASLMLGAILMHLRVRDPLMKSVPAGTVLPPRGHLALNEAQLG